MANLLSNLGKKFLPAVKNAIPGIANSSATNAGFAAAQIAARNSHNLSDAQQTEFLKIKETIEFASNNKLPANVLNAFQNMQIAAGDTTNPDTIAKHFSTISTKSDDLNILKHFKSGFELNKIREENAKVLKEFSASQATVREANANANPLTGNTLSNQTGKSPFNGGATREYHTNDETPAQKIIRETLEKKTAYATAAYDNIRNSNIFSDINAKRSLDDASNAYSKKANRSLDDAYSEKARIANDIIINFMVENPDHEAVKKVTDLYDTAKRKAAADEETYKHLANEAEDVAKNQGWYR